MSSSTTPSTVNGLIWITCNECKVVTMAHKYTAAQIVETLNTYLNEPDSPAHDDHAIHTPLPHHQHMLPLSTA